MIRLAGRTSLAAAVLGLALVAPAAAQMPRMLGDDDPRIGQTVPNVTVWDEHGAPITLHGLEGRYRVLVFGCLT